MKPLYEIFTHKNPASASLRQYSLGNTFSLIDDIALVMDGVVAVESVQESSSQDVTVRVAGPGEFLNLELISNPGTGEIQQYVVESTTATVSLLRASYLRSLLDLGDSSERLELYSMIVKGLAQQLISVTETASQLSSCPSMEKVRWALNRLEEANNQEPVPISRDRIVSHTGINESTVSRAVKKLKEDGGLSEYAQKSIRTQGQRR